MGMFDFVYSEYKLPLPEFQKRQFQTKCLDSKLDEYLLTKKGGLSVRRCGKNGYEKQQWEPIRWPVEPIHFYLSLGADDAEKLGWVEFRVEFANYKIADIITIEHRLPK